METLLNCQPKLDCGLVQYTIVLWYATLFSFFNSHHNFKEKVQASTINLKGITPLYDQLRHPVLRLGMISYWHHHDFPYLLLEVPSLLLIYKHQVEVVPHTELLVDIFHGWCEVIAGQEKPNGNGLPTNWSTIHDLILSYLLVFCVNVGSCVCGRRRVWRRGERGLILSMME